MSSGFEALEPDLDPFSLENQLHGQAFDQAVSETERLQRIEGWLTDMSNTISASIAVAGSGENPIIWGVATPEGMATQAQRFVEISPDEIPFLQQKQEDLDFLLAMTSGRLIELWAQMWQERGSRLFTAWRRNEVEPAEALQTYFKLWNNAPDNFYKDCGMTKAELKALVSDAISGYAAKSKHRRTPDNIIEKEIVWDIEAIAPELDIDIHQLGL